jgi:hypothetical protein
MHLTSARIFFQDYLYFAVCLHEFFFSDVMAARIFFPGIFLCTNFLGGIFTPPPGISNGPLLRLRDRIRETYQLLQICIGFTNTSQYEVNLSCYQSEKTMRIVFILSY